VSEGVRVVSYGALPSQYLDVWSPRGGHASVQAPTAVLVHGGYWRDRYDLHLMDGLAADLSGRGWAAVNLEYRRVGADGGGWPATFEDVVAGLEAAAALAESDADRLVLIGHSAGGHLALLAAASRPLLGVVALAPVSDLREASRRGLSDHAVHGLLGGTPSEWPERYLAWDPMFHLPLGCPTLVVHGDADENVPVELSRAYSGAARSAGDDVTYVELPAGDHFVVIDPSSGAWTTVVAWMEALSGSTQRG
jgi:dipeptidyl aminopeptidase/acylaminoacyl peptidase